jgi:serine phosphatase RsbU (regulator of sigma subunit)
VAIMVRRGRLRGASIVALVLALAATGALTWLVHVLVRDQERRLLRERAAELTLVLNTSIAPIQTTLDDQAGVLRATNNSFKAYTGVANDAVAASTTPASFAWLKTTGPGRFVVLAAAGVGLQQREVITDARTRAFEETLKTHQLVATPVFGKTRILGFAFAPKAGPAHTVLYQQDILGPQIASPAQTSGSPFSELEVAAYASGTVDPSQLILATTSHLPLQGDVRRVTIAVGESHFLLAVSARRPLVGTVATRAPWFTLAAGLIGTLLLAGFVENAVRRRDAAEKLYQSEHHIAETLQRSLLPTLPAVRDLQLAARYLASGKHQEVGGDWFDVFPVAGDRLGIVIGDVMGHDLAAASAMAQIRAALRAYAIDGRPPAQVITRLSALVDTLDLVQLVTVVYGVLDSPGPDGNRVLRYTNAGHLPPLLRHPDGITEALDGGHTVVIGAPVTAPVGEDERNILPGSTVVLFTDGLVERPGGSLDAALDRLADSVAGQHFPDAEAICDHILSDIDPDELRDDLALLVLRLPSADADTSVIPAELTSTAAAGTDAAP